MCFVVRDSDRTFLIAIDPPLVAGDLAATVGRLRANWPPERLVELTASPLEAVVRLAVICLGLTGSMKHSQRLVSLLNHSNERIVAAAEDALWSLWMRAGSPDGAKRLADAILAAQQGESDSALQILRDLIASEPALAEAHHQQAILLHALERNDEAEAAYHATLDLNPDHFAAAAGLGHLCIERDDYDGALDFYKQALKIHPRLTGVREVVPRLEAALHKRDVA